MKIEIVDYEVVKPYHRNPRINAETIAPLKESIIKFGFKVPLVVDKNNVIVTGHARYKAVGELIGNLGKEISELKNKSEKKNVTERTDIIEKIESLEMINSGKIPIIIAKDLSELEAKEFRISDNQVSNLTKWDYDNLKFEIRELESVIGFTTEEINNMMKSEKVTYDNYSQAEIEKETEKLNTHFEKISDTSDEDIDLICPSCGEEFTMKLSDIKSNIKYEKYRKEYE